MTPHFTITEALASHTAERLGIDNTPSPEVLAVIKLTAACMERVRGSLGYPIKINSWYRCPELNKAIGSRPLSQHVAGEAVDFVCPAFGTPLETVRHLVEDWGYIQFDQLIFERSWVHISFKANPHEAPRGEVLTLTKTGHYTKGLPE